MSYKISSGANPTTKQSEKSLSGRPPTQIVDSTYDLNNQNVGGQPEIPLPDPRPPAGQPVAIDRELEDSNSILEPGQSFRNLGQEPKGRKYPWGKTLEANINNPASKAYKNTLQHDFDPFLNSKIATSSKRFEKIGTVITSLFEVDDVAYILTPGALASKLLLDRTLWQAKGSSPSNHDLLALASEKKPSHYRSDFDILVLLSGETEFFPKTKVDEIIKKIFSQAFEDQIKVTYPPIKTNSRAYKTKNQDPRSHWEKITTFASISCGDLDIMLKMTKSPVNAVFEEDIVTTYSKNDSGEARVGGFLSALGLDLDTIEKRLESKILTVFNPNSRPWDNWPLAVLKKISRGYQISNFDDFFGGFTHWLEQNMARIATYETSHNLHAQLSNLAHFLTALIKDLGANTNHPSKSDMVPISYSAPEDEALHDTIEQLHPEMISFLARFGMRKLEQAYLQFQDVDQGFKNALLILTLRVADTINDKKNSPEARLEALGFIVSFSSFFSNMKSIALVLGHVESSNFEDLLTLACNRIKPEQGLIQLIRQVETIQAIFDQSDQLRVPHSIIASIQSHYQHCPKVSRLQLVKMKTLLSTLVAKKIEDFKNGGLLAPDHPTFFEILGNFCKYSSADEVELALADPLVQNSATWVTAFNDMLKPPDADLIYIRSLLSPFLSHQVFSSFCWNVIQNLVDSLGLSLLKLPKDEHHHSLMRFLHTIELELWQTWVGTWNADQLVVLTRLDSTLTISLANSGAFESLWPRNSDLALINFRDLLASADGYTTQDETRLTTFLLRELSTYRNEAKRISDSTLLRFFDFHSLLTLTMTLDESRLENLRRALEHVDVRPGIAKAFSQAISWLWARMDAAQWYYQPANMYDWLKVRVDQINAGDLLHFAVGPLGNLRSLESQNPEKGKIGNETLNALFRYLHGIFQSPPGDASKNPNGTRKEAFAALMDGFDTHRSELISWLDDDVIESLPELAPFVIKAMLWDGMLDELFTQWSSPKLKSMCADAIIEHVDDPLFSNQIFYFLSQKQDVNRDNKNAAPQTNIEILLNDPAFTRSFIAKIIHLKKLTWLFKQVGPNTRNLVDTAIKNTLANVQYQYLVRLQVSDKTWAGYAKGITTATPTVQSIIEMPSKISPTDTKKKPTDTTNMQTRCGRKSTEGLAADLPVSFLPTKKATNMRQKINPSPKPAIKPVLDPQAEYEELALELRYDFGQYLFERFRLFSPPGTPMPSNVEKDRWLVLGGQHPCPAMKNGEHSTYADPSLTTTTILRVLKKFIKIVEAHPPSPPATKSKRNQGNRNTATLQPTAGRIVRLKMYQEMLHVQKALFSCNNEDIKKSIDAAAFKVTTTARNFGEYADYESLSMGKDVDELMHATPPKPNKLAIATISKDFISKPNDSTSLATPPNLTAKKSKAKPKGSQARHKKKKPGANPGRANSRKSNGKYPYSIMSAWKKYLDERPEFFGGFQRSEDFSIAPANESILIGLGKLQSMLEKIPTKPASNNATDLQKFWTQWQAICDRIYLEIDNISMYFGHDDERVQNACLKCFEAFAARAQMDVTSFYFSKFNEIACNAALKFATPFFKDAATSPPQEAACPKNAEDTNPVELKADGVDFTTLAPIASRLQKLINPTKQQISQLNGHGRCMLFAAQAACFLLQNKPEQASSAGASMMEELSLKMQQPPTVKSAQNHADQILKLIHSAYGIRPDLGPLYQLIGVAQIIRQALKDGKDCTLTGTLNDFFDALDIEASAAKGGNSVLELHMNTIAIRTMVADRETNLTDLAKIVFEVETSIGQFLLLPNARAMWLKSPWLKQCVNTCVNELLKAAQDNCNFMEPFELDAIKQWKMWFDLTTFLDFFDETISRHNDSFEINNKPITDEMDAWVQTLFTILTEKGYFHFLLSHHRNLINIIMAGKKTPDHQPALMKNSNVASIRVPLPVSLENRIKLMTGLVSHLFFQDSLEVDLYPPLLLISTQLSSERPDKRLRPAWAFTKILAYTILSRQNHELISEALLPFTDLVEGEEKDQPPWSSTVVSRFIHVVINELISRINIFDHLSAAVINSLAEKWGVVKPDPPGNVQKSSAAALLQHSVNHQQAQHFTSDSTGKYLNSESTPQKSLSFDICTQNQVHIRSGVNNGTAFTEVNATPTRYPDLYQRPYRGMGLSPNHSRNRRVF